MKLKNLGIFTVALLSAIVFFQSCGADKEDKETSTDNANIKWADVKPIIIKSCAGGSDNCHNSTAANSYDWTSPTEATFASSSADYAAAKKRLKAKDMPPVGTGHTLSSSDRKTLESYFR